MRRTMRQVIEHGLRRAGWTRAPECDSGPDRAWLGPETGAVLVSRFGAVRTVDREPVPDSMTATILQAAAR